MYICMYTYVCMCNLPKASALHDFVFQLTFGPNLSVGSQKFVAFRSAPPIFWNGCLLPVNAYIPPCWPELMHASIAFALLRPFLICRSRSLLAGIRKRTQNARGAERTRRLRGFSDPKPRPQQISSSS